MTDAAAAAHSTIGLAETVGLEVPAAAPHFRSAGYCADCGTWAEHGLTCQSCGYDFSGGETVSGDS